MTWHRDSKRRERQARDAQVRQAAEAKRREYAALLPALLPARDERS